MGWKFWCYLIIRCKFSWCLNWARLVVFWLICICHAELNFVHCGPVTASWIKNSRARRKGKSCPVTWILMDYLYFVASNETGNTNWFCFNIKFALFFKLRRAPSAFSSSRVVYLCAFSSYICVIDILVYFCTYCILNVNLKDHTTDDFPHSCWKENCQNSETQQNENVKLLTEFSKSANLNKYIFL